MRSSIKKRGAILSAAVVIGFFAVYLAVVQFGILGEDMGSVAAGGCAVLIVVCIGSVLVGIAVALRQRLREIDEGEEDAAGKF